MDYHTRRTLQAVCLLVALGAIIATAASGVMEAPAWVTLTGIAVAFAAVWAHDLLAP